MAEPKETFYSAFLPVFAVLAVFVVAMMLLTTILFRDVWSLQLRALLFGVAGGLVVCFLSAFLLCVLYPIQASAAGLRAYNFWGAYRIVPWNEIASVGRLNVLGLRYFVIHRKTPGKVYVPTFLSDKAGFRNRVKEWAGADHPLTKALAE